MPKRYVVAGAFAVCLLISQVVLLVLMLDTLDRSHSHIRAQDAKISALFDGARPLLKDAHAAAKPLKKGGSDLVKATDVLPGLALTAREAASEAIPLLRSAPELIATIDRTGLIGRVVQATTDVTHIRAVADDQLQMSRESLRIQTETLAIQRQALAALKRSEAIQRESLAHVRSLDQKSGGQLPTAATP